MEILKVSSHSSPNSVAGAIAGVIREQRAVEVQAVGAGAAKRPPDRLAGELTSALSRGMV